MHKLFTDIKKQSFPHCDGAAGLLILVRVSKQRLKDAYATIFRVATASLEWLSWATVLNVKSLMRLMCVRYR